MFTKLSVKDLEVSKKRVLVRVDFNVPLDDRGRITDDTRIKSAIPTIKYILNQGGKLILMSHLGRPKGFKTPELSLTPCAKKLSELIGRKVIMANDCIGPEVENIIDKMNPGDIVMLENLRFHAGEKNPNYEPFFVNDIVKLGDCYVNDAFGSAHRHHASITHVPQYFINKSAAGFLLENEIQVLNETVLNPEHPFIAIIGGAKISSKIGVLKTLIDKIDCLMIGGGMTYTFFLAQKIRVGNSIHENECIEDAKEIINRCQSQRVKLILPIDNVVVDNLDNVTIQKVIETDDGISNGFQGVDIGPKTIELYQRELFYGKTIFWNGPLGVFEKPPFDKGTNEIAKSVANSNAITVIGGGDSAASIKKIGLTKQISHISTGGGATLEFIEKGSLPGIEALSDSL